MGSNSKYNIYAEGYKPFTALGKLLMDPDFTIPIGSEIKINLKRLAEYVAANRWDIHPWLATRTYNVKEVTKEQDYGSCPGILPYSARIPVPNRDDPTRDSSNYYCIPFDCISKVIPPIPQNKIIDTNEDDYKVVDDGYEVVDDMIDDHIDEALLDKEPTSIPEPPIPAESIIPQSEPVTEKKHIDLYYRIQDLDGIDSADKEEALRYIAEREKDETWYKTREKEPGIDGIFVWIGTPQGRDFWAKLHLKLPYTKLAEELTPEVKHISLYHEILECRLITEENKKIALDYIASLEQNPEWLEKEKATDIIGAVFCWAQTPQGYDFWNDICMKLRDSHTHLDIGDESCE